MSNISIAWEIKFCCARNRLFWFLKNAVRPFFVAKLNPMSHPIIFAYLMQIPFQNCFIYFRMVIPSYIPIWLLSDWWFGTWILFSIYWEFHHPNWLIFFRGVETTNQKMMEQHVGTWWNVETKDGNMHIWHIFWFSVLHCAVFLTFYLKRVLLEMLYEIVCGPPTELGNLEQEGRKDKLTWQVGKKLENNEKTWLAKLEIVKHG